MTEQLKQFFLDLKTLKSAIKADNAKTVNKLSLRKKAEHLSSTWLSTCSPQLLASGHFDQALIERYSAAFRQILRITGPGNSKERYLTLLNSVIKAFKKELLLPLHESPATSRSLSLLTDLFSGLPAEEDSYLREAIGCAQKGFLRGSVVLGWCAAIARIHQTIEQIGLPNFNITSARMASEQKGRFKRFNKVFTVSSVGDLREVFDNDVLWVLEGIQLIDSNQHTRLHSCFEMRCQCAHPGEAPVTEFNLLSFFSDLKEIVFDNSKFQKTTTAPTKG